MITITDQQMYLQIMNEIHVLFSKGEGNLTSSEEERLVELSQAVERWEEKHYPMPMKPVV